ncbi:hypothetical protein DFH09DRAFT_1107130 [Mycena vulgaris]|nr:hypothetical protein DFH09DRAFT_1107130 [Mycena vulgaris]
MIADVQPQGSKGKLKFKFPPYPSRRPRRPSRRPSRRVKVSGRRETAVESTAVAVTATGGSPTGFAAIPPARAPSHTRCVLSARAAVRAVPAGGIYFGTDTPVQRVGHQIQKRTNSTPRTRTVVAGVPPPLLPPSSRLTEAVPAKRKSYVSVPVSPGLSYPLSAALIGPFSAPLHRAQEPPRPSFFKPRAACLALLSLAVPSRYLRAPPAATATSTHSASANPWVTGVGASTSSISCTTYFVAQAGLLVPSLPSTWLHY